LIDIHELLGRELGPHKVIRDEERLERFLVDESGLGRWPAEAAVLAESRDDVEIVLRLAREHRVPVTPRGAGTRCSRASRNTSSTSSRDSASTAASAGQRPRPDSSTRKRSSRSSSLMIL